MPMIISITTIAKSYSSNVKNGKPPPPVNLPQSPQSLFPSCCLFLSQCRLLLRMMMMMKMMAMMMVMRKESRPLCFLWHILGSRCLLLAARMQKYVIVIVIAAVKIFVIIIISITVFVLVIMIAHVIRVIDANLQMIVYIIYCYIYIFFILYIITYHLQMALKCGTTLFLAWTVSVLFDSYFITFASGNVIVDLAIIL